MQEVSVTLEELRGILAELPDGEMLTVTPETEGTAPDVSVDEPCRGSSWGWTGNTSALSTWTRTTAR